MPRRPRPAPGKFIPRPWRPLVLPLFDVAPPDMEKDGPTLADEEWYAGLVDTTALLVVHLLTEVRRNHECGRNVQLQGQAYGRLMAYQEVIHKVFLCGTDISFTTISQGVDRLVKTLGLVVHDPTPGDRFRWPMVPRLVNFKEAQDIVDDAFHGRYPHPSEATDQATDTP